MLDIDCDSVGGDWDEAIDWETLAETAVRAALEGAGQGRLVYTKLYEAFFVELKVALFAAFFVSFPIIANQLWQFVAPGLYAKEKKAFLPFLVATPILFTSGGNPPVTSRS